MDRQIFGGREITVVLAEENRKRPEEMRMRSRLRAPRGYGRPRSPYYGRSRSRSRSPGYRSSYYRHYSRSYSPESRHGDGYAYSPQDKYRRSYTHSRDRSYDRSPVQRPYLSPHRSRDGRSLSRSPYRDSRSPVAPRRRRNSSSPGSRSRSPSGSRSRSANY
eukprot:TRINITY_DN25618_c0_g1_i5.p1 TRINITY_DN25618_c0_g1~~TRINITY_DN25618_c0_g1_i5.p1  ORF type:complete len:162 (-),score=20.35 TRINITY_DN25618_c0_g1_i5:305-790(-)